MPNPQAINDGSMALKGFFRDVWVDKRLEDMSLEMQLHSSVARCFFRWFLTTGYLMELAGPCPWCKHVRICVAHLAGPCCAELGVKVPHPGCTIAPFLVAQ